MLRKGTIQIVFLICCLFLASIGFAGPFSSIAFFYGNHAPIDELRAFDIVVLDPDYATNLTLFKLADSEPFAYVSVGEVSPNRKYYSQVNKNWIIGENTAWQAGVLDQSNPAWREFFVNKVIGPLWQKGYRGFFLDTLDSFHLVAKTPEARKKQIQGLVALIKLIKKRYPKAKLIFNRGFEILPQTHKLAYAVAAESLFDGWNQAEGKYVPVSTESRTWLLDQLNKAKAYGLPIISIDYVSPKERSKARAVAQKIAKLGFIPWVTDHDLMSMGVGSIEVVPRKIIALYDSHDSVNMIADNLTLRFASTPLNYLGYVVIFQDIRKPLPAEILRGRYAGVLSWLDEKDYASFPIIRSWLIKQKNQGLPIIFLGSLGQKFSKPFQKAFDLTLGAETKKPASVKIIYQSKMLGYEIEPIANPYAFLPLTVNAGTRKLVLEDNAGRKSDMVTITSWGGYALNPFVITTLPQGHKRWVINPLAFLKQAFKFEVIPIPDTTTENGRRLMLAHVDGDGFPSRTEWNAKWQAGEAMLKEIFERYKIPTTVSIIEGEISPAGLYPKESKEAMVIARKIFKLPWVEIASHTFSHPFFWHFQSGNLKQVETKYGWHLNIPNYTFNLNKEITGSIKFINQKLAPKGKRCRVILWTGNTNASKQAVALAYKDNVLNMNGGDTLITNADRSLTNIAPLGVYRGQYFQVFAPNQNENMYTNNWTGPYYGYRRVIETFKLTNKPLRFKPIDIYYHMYSATKIASLDALKDVYTWALKQPVMNVFASDYIKGVLDFNHVTIARASEGWIIKTNGRLRELRIPQSLGYPDLAKSQNIVGYSPYGKNYYIHLGPSPKTYLVLTKEKPSVPYIKFANGKITYFKRTSHGFDFMIHSYLPTKFTLDNMSWCRVSYDRGRVKKYKKVSRDLLEFDFKDEMNHAFSVQCR